MKKLLISMVAVLATAGMAMGVGFNVADVSAAAGDTIVIPIEAVGAGNLQGLNLYLEVAAPLEIKAISLAEGIFASNNSGLVTDLYPTGTVPAPQYAVGTTTTTSGSVPAPGILASVTIAIPAGTANGDYFLRTSIPDFGYFSDFAGSTGVTVDGQGQALITVPEPATALMLLGLAPLLRRRSA